MKPGIQDYRGLALPAHETHLIAWMEKVGQMEDGKPAYQKDKRDAALRFVKDFGVAVDVGGHCGLFSAAFVKRFAHVRAFEPVALHRECFQMNVIGGSVALMPFALGDKEGTVSIQTSDGSSGDSWVGGSGDIPLRIYDNLNWAHDDKVGFVKLDCEGYEYYALHGMEQMLKRDRPTLLVEQKPGRAQKFGLRETQACEYLVSMGFKQRFVKSGDYCFTGD